jgi:hypothetical protein
VCSPDRSFEYSQYFPNNKINSAEVSMGALGLFQTFSVVLMCFYGRAGSARLHARLDRCKRLQHDGSQRHIRSFTGALQLILSNLHTS